MTEDGFISTHSDQAIELVIAVLKERAKRQTRGFQISSRAVRKALAEHFDRDTDGVWKLAAFVMDALESKGVLKPLQ